MHIGFYNYHKVNNAMLESPTSSIGDNLMYPFFLLGKRLKSMGHTASVIIKDSSETFDAIVFVEFPGTSNAYLKKLIASNFKNLYLILLESPIVKPDNYDLKNHAPFKKIFTWDDNLVDGVKYFKIQYAHQIPTEFNFNGDRKKLCAMIAGNKSGNDARELYSQRIEAIRWFEAHHPEDFDLYGKGWDHYNFQGNILGVRLARLNRLKFLTKLLAPYYPSYRGSVASKNETYQQYKFSICYENAKDITGYITEKIMDCFLAGCVPIYWGAPNIADFIPANTFIDKKKFTTYEALYAYIKNMSHEEYVIYQKNIADFLTGEKAKLFSADFFADTLIKEIIR